MNATRLFRLLGAVLAALPLAAAAQPTRHVYYGDLHLHTNFSLDAFILNGRTLDPDDAYRFARGEPVDYMGRTIRRAQPLDFIAITDHAENLGLASQLARPDSPVFETEVGKIWKEQGPFPFWNAIVDFIKAGTGVPGVPLDRYLADAWQQEIAAANAAYQPGRFTTFIGFEWTAYPDGQNLHRNIIFLGDNPPTPFSSYDSQRPEDLWTWLEKIRALGHEAMAIPHNGNASNGLMYDWVDSDGKPIDREYAERRLHNEPLSEIVQSKGQSETHPALSEADEFANFELFTHLLASETVGKVPGSYIREAYGRGLALAERTGVNPYQFGVAGGTDFHNGVSTAAEDAYSGDMIGTDPGAEFFTRGSAADRLRPGNKSSGNVDRLETSAGALTAVWAEENTRESIYAALRRKETFATSGPRIQLRFFAGWSFPDDIFRRQRWTDDAYRGGVPMGGELGGDAAAGAGPDFLVWAVKDPDGAPLERVQIIKVWAEGGEPRERVFDVGLAPSGAGAAQLSARWRDPDFRRGQAALYYVRALQVPTPRWSTQLARRHGLAAPAGVAAEIRERAWSSPIWYSPRKR